MAIGSSKFDRGRLLAVGQHSYLQVATGQRRITDGQCIIAPIEHCPSMAALDEEVYAEIREFRDAVRSMYAKSSQGVLFLETALVRRRGEWAQIDCVPVPRSVESDAPMYFKTALDEARGEHATHNRIINRHNSKRVKHDRRWGEKSFTTW